MRLIWAPVHPVSVDHPSDVSTTCLDSTGCKNQLIEHDLERHTPVYIRSHSWQYMSEQKPSHEVDGIVCRAPRQDLVEGTKKMSASLKVPKNTVASIILKWKKFWTTKNLPRAGRLAKLRNRGRRALVREVNKNPDVHSDRALEFLCGDGRTFQKDNHLFRTPPISPLW
jgi:hypothetical protein